MKNQSLILLLPLLLFVAACGGKESDMQESDETQEMRIEDGGDMANAEAPQTKVNINTGSAEVFMTIPGVGERMVHEFEEYRPYTTIVQFRREIGKYVDDEQVAAYEEYIFVPIDPNEADSETLQQIPGLDESEAEELIAARPFDSNADFMGAISEYISEEELEIAASYVDSE